MDFDRGKNYLLTQEDIDSLEFKFKIHLMNSVTGYMSANPPTFPHAPYVAENNETK